MSHRERLQSARALRRRGLVKVRTVTTRRHRLILFCPRTFRRGACVPQALLHLHR